MKNDDQVRQSGRNIFKDLDLPDAEELNAKARIVCRICEILDERGLTQKAAAQILGVDQPKISALLRGRLDGFSTDRLFRFLNALGNDVEIVIKPIAKRGAHAGIRVLAAA